MAARWPLAGLAKAAAMPLSAYQGAIRQAGDDCAEVMELLSEATVAYPEDPDLLNNFAWFLLTVGDERFRHPDAALALARKAVRLTGEKDANALDTLALALFRAGDGAGAVAAQEKAVALDPEDEEYRQRLEEYRGLKPTNRK